MTFTVILNLLIISNLGDDSFRERVGRGALGNRFAAASFPFKLECGRKVPFNAPVFAVLNYSRNDTNRERNLEQALVVDE